MKHFRNSFPSNMDFSDWFILSKKGTVAKLVLHGRNLHGHNIYLLRFENGQIGAREFTMEELFENGVQRIRKYREDLFDEQPVVQAN